MDCSEIMTGLVQKKIRERIEEADGHEILIIAILNNDKIIEDISFAAMGTENAVPAIFSEMQRGDLVLHNHPSGRIKPSSADLNVASSLGNSGVGFYIIDNKCQRYFPVCEPSSSGHKEELNKEKLSAILEPGGSLSTHFPSFEPRESQISMLQKVAEGFNNNGIVLIEAGTGVGKSFAYLLPAVQWAAKNKERVVVSTATINLQHQLLEKDIPIVKKLLNVDIKVELVKGRGNYICHRRLLEALEEDSLFRAEGSPLEQFSSWIEVSQTGCYSELNFLPDRQDWAKVCAEVESCTGIRCPFHDKCFFIKARKKALGANLLIVNHHLLFSDISLRLNGAGYEQAAVLPPFQKVIFDEAHNMENSATSYFSSQISRFSVGKALNRLYRKRKGLALGCFNALSKASRYPNSDEVPHYVGLIQQNISVLDALMCDSLENESAIRIDRQTMGTLLPLYEEKMEEISKQCRTLADLLKDIIDEVDEEFLELPEVFEAGMVRIGLNEIGLNCAKFLHIQDFEEDIFWIEIKRTMDSSNSFIQWNITPIQIGPLMNEALFIPFETVVCTSATLSVKKDFSFFKNRIGLNLSDKDRLTDFSYPSPFDYKNKVLLGLPTDAPLPADPSYTDYVGETVKQILEISEGHALVLFTSYQMLRTVYNQVIGGLKQKGIVLLKQGDDHRQKLMDQFKEDESSVLFATDSFWEGIDAPGDCLKIVIICRLPFRVPTHPVLKARLEAIDKRGGNPFFQLSLPDAVMKLKQGFGRLMRKTTDSGAVFILDPRIIKKSYGSIFIQSLPPVTPVKEKTEDLLVSLENFLY